jgi:hypothetical protein
MNRDGIVPDLELLVLRFQDQAIPQRLLRMQVKV